MEVKLPRVLVDYACARSLACCAAPFRASVAAAEEAPLLSRAAAAHFEAPLAAALSPSRGGARQFRQPNGACTLLDGTACGLQHAVGLSAMPAICRNFPRSVLRTPTGVEVAFMLSCPTASALVARAPVPFEWAAVDAETWPYAPSRRLGRGITLDGATRLKPADLAALRDGWWATIQAGHTDAIRLLDALHHLTIAPAAPGAPAALGDVLLPAIPGAVAVQLVSAAMRVKERGRDYTLAKEALYAGLQQPRAAVELAERIAGRTSAFAVAAELGVQLACGHVTAPVGHALALAGWQTVMSMLMLLAVEEAGLSGPSALGDALCIAAQVGGETLFGRWQLLA